MEKILELDLDSKEELFETYNGKKVSHELIQYMIDTMPTIKKGDTLKVIIHNRIKGHLQAAELIKKEIDAACDRNDSRFRNTNVKQVSFLLIGVLALLVASFINSGLLYEIIIIGAWVLLWDVVEMEIDDVVNNRKRKRKLKKILESEFEEIFE